LTSASTLIMKVPSLVIISILLFIQQTSAQKTCSTGTANPCPKGQNCVAPQGSESGAQGVCGKSCDSGTKNPCPKGQTCYTSGSTEPGASGTCVSDNLCYPVEDSINALQDFIVDRIVQTYTTVLDSTGQGYMLQWLAAHPAMCAGPNQVNVLVMIHSV